MRIGFDEPNLLNKSMLSKFKPTKISLGGSFVICLSSIELYCWRNNWQIWKGSGDAFGSGENYKVGFWFFNKGKNDLFRDNSAQETLNSSMTLQLLTSQPKKRFLMLLLASNILYILPMTDHASQQEDAIGDNICLFQWSLKIKRNTVMI